MMDRQNDSPDPPRRPLARHLSDADRLRKVIQELVDTEKSYVKVKPRMTVYTVFRNSLYLVLNVILFYFISCHLVIEILTLTSI